MDQRLKCDGTSSEFASKEVAEQSNAIAPPSVKAATHVKSANTNPKLAFVSTLPIRLDVKIPIVSFRFKDLLGLAEGSILKTTWSLAEDLPVAAGSTRLLWAEFAVADQQLTVRVTRVA